MTEQVEGLHGDAGRGGTGRAPWTDAASPEPEVQGLPRRGPVRRGIIVAHNGAAIFGGAERWTVRLLQRLQDRGHRVLLFCRDEEMRERVEAFGVPAEVGHLGGHVALHDALRMAARLKSLAPDGLLLTTFKKTWLGAMAGRLAGVPRVVARIGLETDLPGRRAVYGIAFRRWIHRVVVNADGLRAPVLADVPGLPASRVVTIHNGVEPTPRRGPAGALRAELGIPEGAPVVGTVARLADQKRLDRLIEVVARLPEPVRAIVAGDGPERGVLEALARELGLAGRVTFLGHREDVGNVLDALDLFLITSRVEGMSNAMLEALGAGVPVVSTPVSGAQEALEPLEDGRRPGVVVEPEADVLAREVGALLADPERLREMGRAARVRARERFDPDERARRWETLLVEDVDADVHDGPSHLDDPLGLPPT